MDKILEYIKIDGKEYGLTQSAYFESNYQPRNSDSYRAWYQASAINENGEPCEIIWQITREWERANEIVDAYNTYEWATEQITREQEELLDGLTPTEIAHAYGVLEDEGNACDWDSPELKK